MKSIGVRIEHRRGGLYQHTTYDAGNTAVLSRARWCSKDAGWEYMSCGRSLLAMRGDEVLTFRNWVA